MSYTTTPDIQVRTMTYGLPLLLVSIGEVKLPEKSIQNDANLYSDSMKEALRQLTFSLYVQWMKTRDCSDDISSQ